MRLTRIMAVVLFAVAAPALAERLEFDYRLYPPLQRVLDAGDKAMIDFNARNPERLVDVVAVRGKSARNWSEALEIISIVRPADVPGAREWMVLQQQQALAKCPSATFALIAEDTNSVTFERRSPNCSADRASQGIYRLVAGKRSWFQLGVLVKGELDPQARQQWLALLASAHLD